uniref:Uncharacterized protein n=1 Tax=Candidatus Kentrum sp. TC TaxID=2126339 RepID=A0A450YXC4_9GAMM|nr:MAG: hypothetical protein BECKTC1821E_GA0114239_10604 [Candidatus Kentron sp. TC]
MGTGKSTLFYVFKFLKEALSGNIHTPLVKLGGNRGFREVRTRGVRGNIEIELKFRAKPKVPLVIYFLSIGRRAVSPWWNERSSSIGVKAKGNPSLSRIFPVVEELRPPMNRMR